MKACIKLGSILLITNILFGHSSLASNTSDMLEPSSQSIQFFKKQVNGGTSITNTIKNLADRYPQRTTEFISIAFSAYPQHYKEIITASVSTRPMFVEEIIMLANKHKVASPTEIIEIAVNAEPSYAGVATSAACKYSPEYFNEIIRTAVTAEPDSADQIAQKLVKAYPSKTMEILITTIKEVPFVGKYILDALLVTVDNDTVEQLARYPDAIERLVEIAQQRDIDSDKIRLSAMKGGLSEEEIVSVIKHHYSDSQTPAVEN
jgi:hypothetical protein